MAAQPDGRAAGPVPCRPRRPFPWVLVAVAALAAAAAAIQASPPAQAALELHRQRVAAGQWWRLWTGNLVHFSWSHLAADTAALALVCLIACWRRLGGTALMVVSAWAVGLAVCLGAGHIVCYRGLSGVKCAVQGLVLTGMARQDRPLLAGVWVGALALLFARAAVETATGRTPLPTSLPEGVEVVGAAHLAGLATGTLWGLLGRTARARCGWRLPKKRPWPDAGGCVIRKAL